MAERKTQDQRRKTQDINLSSFVPSPFDDRSGGSGQAFLSSSLKEHLINGGRIERDGDLLRLSIPPATSEAYTDAQLDDYEHELPRTFVNSLPQHLHIRARFSHPAGQMKGTAGFGFWNHPFTREGGVIEPPRNVWFFYGSLESNMQLVHDVPGHGFKAATLNTPLLSRSESEVDALASKALIAAGNLALKLPIVSRWAMAAARSVVTANEVLLNLDMTQWHDYEIDWLRDEAIFRVDEREVLRAPKPPRAAMGFVAWVDNYRATATPDGQYEFAYVDVPEPQWMEVRLVQ